MTQGNSNNPKTPPGGTPPPPAQGGPQSREIRLQVELDPAVANGIYANLAYASCLTAFIGPVGAWRTLPSPWPTSARGRRAYSQGPPRDATRWLSEARTPKQAAPKAALPLNKASHQRRLHQILN